MRAIFANNICKIPHCLFFVERKVYFVVENTAIKCTKTPESIVRKKNLGYRIVCNHTFGPVNHWNSIEIQLMFSKVKHSSIINNQSISRNAIKILQHWKGLFITNDSYLWIFLPKSLY